MMPRKGIRYALVQLSHPVVENLFAESNVIYGVKIDLNIFSPRSQVVNWDFDTRWACNCDTQVAHPVEDTRRPD